VPLISTAITNKVTIVIDFIVALSISVLSKLSSDQMWGKTDQNLHGPNHFVLNSLGQYRGESARWFDIFSIAPRLQRKPVDDHSLP